MTANEIRKLAQGYIETFMSGAESSIEEELSNMNSILYEIAAQLADMNKRQHREWQEKHGVVCFDVETGKMNKEG